MNIQMLLKYFVKYLRDPLHNGAVDALGRSCVTGTGL